MQSLKSTLTLSSETFFRMNRLKKLGNLQSRSSHGHHSHHRERGSGGEGWPNSDSPIGWLSNGTVGTPYKICQSRDNDVANDGLFSYGKNRTDNVITVTDEELSDDEMFTHGIQSVSRNNGVLSRTPRSSANSQNINHSPLKIHGSVDASPSPPESRIVA